MPYKGQVISGKEIGKGGGKYIWAVCPNCPEGKAGRWTQWKAHLLDGVRRCRAHHIAYQSQVWQINQDRREPYSVSES